MTDARARRRPLLLFVPLAMLLCALSRGGEPGTAVSVRPVPHAWVSDIAVPVTVDALSREGGTLRLVFTGGRRRQIHTVALAPGKAARIELPLFLGDDGRLDWSIGGDAGTRPMVWPSAYGDELPPILAADAFLLREIEEAVQRSGKRRTVASVPARELPADWRSYAGLRAVLVLKAADAEALPPERCGALAQWVRWFGGVLWLAGDAEERGRALARLGLQPSEGADAGQPPATDAFFLNGRVKLLDAVSPAAAAARIARDESAPGRLIEPSRIGRGAELLENLGGIPVSFIIPSLLLLGIFLGPVTYWIVRRKNNPLLFFLIVPAAALLGAAGIVFGALFIEGAGSEYNQAALLIRDAGSDAALFLDRRGVRPGFAVPEPRFGADALALPFADNREETTLDLTDGLRLGAGWLLPRFATGYLAARPVVSRMNIAIQPEGDGCRAVNNLGFRVAAVAARLPDGGYGWAENIPPGGAAPLARGGGERRYGALALRLAGMNDNVFPAGNLLLVAEADGLPYADDGGLGGTLREGSFFYAVGGDGGPSGGEGGEGGASDAE